MRESSVETGGMNLPLYSLNTLIIGSGTAGLNAAVCLHRYGQKDIAIATDFWGGGTSNNAGSDKQTYYKLALSGDAPDSPEDMAGDLFRGGCMHGDIALCEAMHSAQAFYNLVNLGVPFPHDVYGAYVGYKTDHDPRGRATSAGPLTSHLMFEALAKEVIEKGIKVFDRHEIVGLLAAM
jgi:succinate dehydrogenase/fumarate reductase flavoprotein subunit